MSQRDGEPDLLDHEYDGIREYDNPMPQWWLLIFYASCAFAVGYVFYYHLSGRGSSVAADYDAEVAIARRAEAKRALGEKVSEDGLGKLMVDTALMADAKLIFGQRCSPCHGEFGQGVIGPNLSDDHWIHGNGTLMDIHGTISEGVLSKGMPAWKMQLSPLQVRELAAFVGSLRGKNLPGKAPEGTLVTTKASP
jgi:cytochrome c oxidase cbb3-type subunit III